jgi:uncharacterized membrane protein
MEKKTFSIDEAVKIGWLKMQENFLFFIGLFLFVLLYSSALSALQLAVTRSNNLYSSVFATLFFILGCLISIIVSIGLIKITVKIVDGKKPLISDLYTGYPYFWRYLGGSLLYGLLVLAGFILLIIPGVYWMIKYFFVPYLIIDKNMSIRDSFKESAKMTESTKWSLFGFFAVQKTILYLGLLVFFIGLFATLPTALISQAHVYRKLS